MKPKLTPAQVGRAGEYFVPAEIHRRGGYAVTLCRQHAWHRHHRERCEPRHAGDHPGEDAHVGYVDTRVPRDAEQALPVDEESAFWAFVDLSTDEPGYFFAPRWWIRNDIYEVHTAFLAKHGGVRPVSPESSHHAIPLARIEQWRDRWDALGIFPRPADPAMRRS